MHQRTLTLPAAFTFRRVHHDQRAKRLIDCGGFAEIVKE